MKIRILKKEKIDERFQINPKMSSQYMLDNLFNPNSKDSILNKKLVFYDFETNGFLPDAYVHQIAALEFDLSDAIKKIFNGEDYDLPQAATDGLVVKAKFDVDDFRDKDERTIDERGKLRANLFTRKSSKIDMAPFLAGRNRISVKKETNLYMSPEDVDVTIGCVLARDESARQDLGSKINLMLDFLNRDEVGLSDNLKTFIATCLNSDIAADGQTTYTIKNPSFLVDGRELSASADDFFSDLYALCRTLSSSPYGYPSRRGGLRYKTTKEIKDKLKGYKTGPFAFTYGENKTFTHYDDFPLEKYEDLQFTVNDQLPNEKQGINAFLDYLIGLGKNKYILVGHNIKSFDNTVIMQRGELNGVSKRKLSFFQDSYALDTLTLMNLYKKQIAFFNSLSNEIEAELQISDKSKDVASRATQNAQTLIAKYETLKAKLEGLMKLHDATKDFEQTHTADDDCEKLAQVTVPTILELYEMQQAFREITEMLDLNPYKTDKPGARTFQSGGNIQPAQIAKTISSKIKGDVLQQGSLTEEDALMLSNKEDVKKAVSDVIYAFCKDLVEYQIENSTLETREEITHSLSNLKTKKVNDLFIPWLAKEKEDLAPQTFDGNEFQPVDPASLADLDIPDMQRVDESKSLKVNIVK